MLSELQRLNDLAETAEDFAHIERQLLAIESADRETSRQKATLGSLTQQAVAWFFGCSTKHIRDQQPARNLDGTYDGPDAYQFFLTQELEKAKKQWERQNDKTASAIERKNMAQAIKAEEEAKGAQGTYMLTADRDLQFVEITSAVRTEIEAIPRAMANNFPAELRDQLVKELTNETRQVLRRLAGRGRQIGVE